jgi:DNA-binding HxlR family transcriptional regulator
VEREVMSDERTIVVYRLNEHGASIRMLIQSVIDWGLKHREVVLGPTDKARA